MKIKRQKISTTPKTRGLCKESMFSYFMSIAIKSLHYLVNQLMSGSPMITSLISKQLVRQFQKKRCSKISPQQIKKRYN